MKISLFSLVLLIVAAIDSIRTLPTTALFGSSLIFYFALAALLFLIPVSFISAEFASRFPSEGGIFHWIRNAFGEKIGLLAVWLQWINTMVWYPTMLLFTVGTAAHLFDPALAQNGWFLLPGTLAVFWGLTALNLRGIQVSAKMNAFCGTVGTLIPMGFLIVLGAIWFFSGKELAISWEGFNFKEQGTALVTIMASFLGMELAGAHVGDIEKPEKNFPKAIAYSVAILLGTLMFGALAIAIVIPRGEIQFADGVMQTFRVFLEPFHLSFLLPVLALLIILGTVGGSVNWLLSPAKGLLHAAEFGFLPKYFAVKNRGGVSIRILVAQAILVSLFCFGMQLVPSVNEFYWLLMALSTGLYMLMYILLFLAALKLGRPKEGYQIPRGMRRGACFAGLLGAFLTIALGFEPPPGGEVQVGAIGLGFVTLIAPVFFLWKYREYINHRDRHHREKIRV
jgi:amino acid transporter